MIVAQVAENAAPRHQVVVLRRRVHCVHRKPHPATFRKQNPCSRAKFPCSSEIIPCSIASGISQQAFEFARVLRKVLRRTRHGIQYVEHTEGDGGEMFKAVCKLGLEGIVSKKLNAPYRSGPSRNWIKVKNPKAQAATRAIDGTF